MSSHSSSPSSQLPPHRSSSDGEHLVTRNSGNMLPAARKRQRSRRGPKSSTCPPAFLLETSSTSRAAKTIRRSCYNHMLQLRAMNRPLSCSDRTSTDNSAREEPSSSPNRTSCPSRTWSQRVNIRNERNHSFGFERRGIRPSSRSIREVVAAQTLSSGHSDPTRMVNSVMPQTLPRRTFDSSS